MIMKKSLLTAFIGTVALAVSAQSFEITGNIPGLKQGTNIELKSRERGAQHSLGKTVVESTDGTFSLSGSVASPTLAELYIDQTNPEGLAKAVELMIENAPISISAAHIDSVPPSFFTGTGGLKMRKNVTITGGNAQKQYAEYLQAMLPYDLAARQAHYDLFWADGKKGRSKEEESRLKEIYENAGLKEDSARRAFIVQHPSYSISGLLLMYDLNSPFFYSESELNEVHDRMQQLDDAKRLEQVNRAIEASRKFLRESPYTDFAVGDTLNNELHLSDFTKNGKYVMIDFWASWCGPCRAAIPHVRELYHTYGDKLDILAISVDSEESAWRKAMDQEKMEWTQLWAGDERSKPLVENYGLSGIPFLLVLSPDGRIIHAGHDPAGVNAILEKELGK